MPTISAESKGTSANTRVSTDHEEIRHWVTTRNGYPARIKTDPPAGTGIIKIQLPEDGDTMEGVPLERISWEEFFEEFESQGMAFLFQDHRESSYCELIER